MATQEHSYRGYPIIYRVSIGRRTVGGMPVSETNPAINVDVSDHVIGIDNIQSSLDYPTINEFRIAEATITLRDPDNDFNPYNENNHYKTYGTLETPEISSSGYRCPVTITAGFEVDGVSQDNTTKVLYSGQILNVTKDAKTKEVTILCSDESQKIRTEPVTNFGIQRRMKVEGAEGSLHGNYPFFSGLNEPSLESVEGTSNGSTLDRKNVLQTEGNLVNTNFRELATGIETEGGLLNNDPILEFKSPYRNRTVESITEKLLDKYGITSRDIELPIAANTGKYFSNLGRPTYETNLIDTDEDDPGIWQWPGTVTDMLAHIDPDTDPPKNDLYLLISPTGSKIEETPNPKPRIIKWDLNTDDKTLVTEIKGDTDTAVLEECWKFVANNDFSTFYVLGTSPSFQRATPRELGTTARGGSEFGSYDSSEGLDGITGSESKVLIHRLVQGSTGWTRTTYLDKLVSSDLWPQLAMHYHLGFSPTASESQNRLPNRSGNIPDSRRNLFLDGTTLYYPFANRTKFGIAKSSTGNTGATRVIEANRDDDGFNLAGFDFWVEGSYAYLAYTHIRNNGTHDSRFRIVRTGK